MRGCSSAQTPARPRLGGGRLQAATPQHKPPLLRVLSAPGGWGERKQMSQEPLKKKVP